MQRCNDEQGHAVRLRRMPLLTIHVTMRYLPFLSFIIILFAGPAAMAHRGSPGDAATMRKAVTVPAREAPVNYKEGYVYNGGSIRGVVRVLSDTAVDGIKDAVVYIKGIQRGKAFTWSPENIPVIDQKDLVFVPHITITRAGSTVELRNADPETHNLHSYSVKNASFNEGIPAAGKPVRKKFDFVEMVRIGCDIHREMAAWIVVRDNPYYCLTDKDGTFRITDIPPGTYRLAVWHEDFDREELAPMRTNIEVKSGKEFEVDFYLCHKR